MNDIELDKKIEKVEANVMVLVTSIEDLISRNEERLMSVEDRVASNTLRIEKLEKV